MFKEIVLKDNSIIQGKVLAKTITLLVVRTADNKFLLISRDFLRNEDEFKFRD